MVFDFILMFPVLKADRRSVVRILGSLVGGKLYSHVSTVTGR